jgi:hypothetical protein
MQHVFKGHLNTLLPTFAIQRLMEMFKDLRAAASAICNSIWDAQPGGKTYPVTGKSRFT